MAMTFGAWLQSKRGRPGDPGFVSQSELAERMGVTRSFIGQLEDPNRPTPRYVTRQKVHAALGTTEDELIALGIVRPATMRVGTATATARAEPSTPDQFPAIWADLDDDEQASMMNIMEALVTRRRLLDAQRPEPEKRVAEDRKRYAP